VTVKTIFKVLIGTVVIIVVSSLLIEIYNISTTGLQINQISKMAGRQACDLFSQETYKIYDESGNAGGIIDMGNIIDMYGSIYIEGKFYTSNDPETIYQDLYYSSDFKDWLSSEPAVQKGDWYNLKLLDRAINDPSSLITDIDDPDYTEATTARLYRDVMMTPLNLGIPYLDLDTVNRMYRWNLAQLLSNCKPELIKIDEDGITYVEFKGFRVFADSAAITNLEYKTFDLTDMSDRVEFNQITNINPDNIEFDVDINLKENLDITDDERTRVCVVGIEYKVPITYEGITPIKQVFNFVWNNEVEGYNSGVGRTGHQEWTSSVEDLESGGFHGMDTEGVLPVPGKLIYHIMR